ncbi:hypothetical protein BS47DRAFT_980656 [Hydnum rufescens UP504]|uniref:Uncharacterized protein n=1 Tax=Hydnum rufescens UP504 TaxID=1448309 RepID=A0A9P6DSH6_9AGAM|nr:hypothetical protein BS47DRAFT_980656 [Hydnum rufescens UP504]
MPSPATPVTPKRGVRFASISSEGDTDPPILIVHPSTPAEELEIESSPRLKVPPLQTSKPNIEERRRAQEQARRREEANERARQQGEAQRKLQEEVIAARLRRESFRLDGGSSSVRAWNDFGQKMDPLSTGTAGTLRKPATRRSATDPEAMSLPRQRGSWASPPLHPFPLDTSSSRRGGAPVPPHFPNSSPRSLNSPLGSSRPHRASVTSTTFAPSHLSPNSAAASTSAQSDDPSLRKRQSLMPGDLSRSRLDDTRSIRSLTHASRPLPASSSPLPTGFYPSYPTPPMGAPMVVMQPVYILPTQIGGSMFPWGSGPVPNGGAQGTMPLVPSQHAGAASPRPVEPRRRSHPISGSAPSTGTPRARPKSERDLHPT